MGVTEAKWWIDNRSRYALVWILSFHEGYYYVMEKHGDRRVYAVGVVAIEPLT